MQRNSVFKNCTCRKKKLNISYQRPLHEQHAPESFHDQSEQSRPMTRDLVREVVLLGQLLD